MSDMVRLKKNWLPRRKREEERASFESNTE